MMDSKDSSETIPEEKKDLKPYSRITKWLLEPVEGPSLPEDIPRTDEFGRPLTHQEMAIRECWDLRAMWAKCELNRTWLQSCSKEDDVYQKCLRDFRAVSEMMKSTQHIVAIHLKSFSYSEDGNTLKINKLVLQKKWLNDVLL
jgi:hypothetical protein